MKGSNDRCVGKGSKINVCSVCDLCIMPLKMTGIYCIIIGSRQLNNLATCDLLEKRDAN